MACFTIETTASIRNQSAIQYEFVALTGDGKPRLYRGIIERNEFMERTARSEAAVYAELHYPAWIALCYWLDEKGEEERLKWLPYEMVFLNALEMERSKLRPTEQKTIVKKVAEV